jgi:RNA polymerase sigma factor (sigma-70 family)
MYGVCLRYAPNSDVAHDILQEGFIKVFQSLFQFRQQAALSSWLRRIFVTTAINYIQRKLTNKFEVSINDDIENQAEELSEIEKEHWLNNISAEEALEMVQQLPEKYRLIINLYAIEKMNHEEIGTALNMLAATSRSQLARARKLLSEKLNLLMKHKIGN